MKRIQSVDTIKFLAITAVVCLHTTPFYVTDGSNIYSLLFVIINQVARFAVPFFFVMSGYFFAKKAAQSDSILRLAFHRVKKLGFLWGLFSLIYLMPYKLISAFEYGIWGPFKIIYLKSLHVVGDPIKLLFEGTMVHLWFLVSLIWAILITALIVHFCKVRSLLFLGILSVVLYVFGLLAHSYSESPLGVDISFNTRNGPFFSLIFFVIGWGLFRFEICRKHFLIGIAVMILGYGIHLGEMLFLYRSYGVLLTSHDYLGGTLLVGLGVSLVALSGHSWLAINWMSEVSKYTLGIYGIHVVFIDLMFGVDSELSSLWWELGFVFIVLVLSIVGTALLASNKRLNRFLI